MFLINNARTIFLASLALTIAGCVGNQANNSSQASSSSLASAGKYCGGDAREGSEAYILGTCGNCHGTIDGSSGMTPGVRGMPALDPNADVYFYMNVATELALNEYIAKYMIQDPESECIPAKCADNIATYLHTLAGYCD